MISALRSKRLSFVIAAIVCCSVLFAVGLGFGLKDPPNKGPLINERIHVIPPKFGHAPVRAETIATARDVLEKLPRKVYRLLEEGGASVNLAPNIEDNWPGSGDGIKPGTTDTTMGEEGARCYDRAAWIYESKKVRGSHELKPPRSQDEQRKALYQILGHAINDAMGVMTNTDELKKDYILDMQQLPEDVRYYYREELLGQDEERALACSLIIGILIGGDPYEHRRNILNDLPRTTAYLKKRLEIK